MQLNKKPNSIIGVDFSEKMIEFAQLKIKEEKINNISFQVGDIRQLQFEDQTFDLTYTTRVLINLPNWEEQKQGINECLRVTKSNGIVILSEAFWEPLILLNSIRTIKQLPPLVEHDFNRYLKKQKLTDFLNQLQAKYEIIDFSSIYYLGSRFLRELVTNIEDYEGYSNPINEIFYNIEKQFSGGDFGIQQAYVIYK
jgi:ubiquinone/menaquinone biosynthesis C-methylase UbiE